MTFWSWSRTAATNATADSTINFAEGQAPSSVNDSARAVMAAAAKYRDDISGAIVTGGSATAYTVTSYEVFDTLAHLSGQMIAFVPHATNTNAVGVDITLNVDGLGAKSIRAQPSVALPNGSLVLGTPYVVVYNNSDAVFYLQGMTNPYNVPLASGMDFWGTTAPNTSFAFPIGQAISRTTYATLFSIMSTTYGSGDGSTTFNLPDKTGRVSAMKEASATRLTTAVGGVDGATMGSASGSQSQTLTLSQLPGGINSSGTNLISVTSTPNVIQNATVVSATTSGGGQGVFNSPSPTNSQVASSANNAINVASNNTGGLAHPNVQPTIICNYIIRII